MAINQTKSIQMYVCCVLRARCITHEDKKQRNRVKSLVCDTRNHHIGNRGIKSLNIICTSYV